MKKICVNCGKEFDAIKESQNCCCKKCLNHYGRGYKRTREELYADTERRKEETIRLFQSGLSIKETALKVDKSYSWTATVIRNAGLEKHLTPLQQQIKELRLQGLCSVEIAEQLNKDTKYIKVTVDKIGMPFTEEEKRHSLEISKKKCKDSQYGTVEERSQKQSEFLKEYHPDWKYISGWLNGDDLMKFKCLKCGNEFEKSAVTIRHRKDRSKCPFCEAIAIQKRKEKSNQQREQREQEKLFRFWNQDFEQTSIGFSECPECGAFFISKNGLKYCSEGCRRRSLNRKADKRTRKTLKTESDITLKKLFKRDEGICWICGGKCDFKDYFRDENGNFIVGKNYPSIDHVYPLSKGGDHTWLNVKLAHHYCNTLKRDKVVC